MGKKKERWKQEEEEECVVLSYFGTNHIQPKPPKKQENSQLTRSHTRTHLFSLISIERNHSIREKIGRRVDNKGDWEFENSH